MTQYRPSGEALALGSIAIIAGMAAASSRLGSRAQAPAIAPSPDTWPTSSRWMTLDAVRAAEPAASDAGVSRVARSSRGFVRAYELVRGYRELQDAVDPYSEQRWGPRRQAFIKRHTGQVAHRGEALWSEGPVGAAMPSRRHLALMMWAYTPTPEITQEWLQGQGYSGGLWAT